MQRKRVLYLLAILALLASVLPVAALAQNTVSQPSSPASDQPSDETLLEQARALAAEQSPSPPEIPTALSPKGGGAYPLFVGVDDTTVPAYRVDVTTNAFNQAFLGFQVWGAAYDQANDKVYFNNGSTLYEWPVGGAVATLGTITDPAGATQSMTGLAFYNGTLYGVKNIANEAVYTIDTTTRVATVYIDYVDANFDFGGLAADPNTGTLYATNDDTTPNGSGLFRINLDGTGTLITPYPAGQTDVDGLAVSHDGFAYLVTDEAGFIYVWDFAGGAYVTPLNNPWTSSEVFSAGTWIWEAQQASISLAKTVGTTAGVCAASSAITVPAGTTVYYCYTVTNTGSVTLDLHTLVDDQLGTIFSGLNYSLAPGSSVNTVQAGLSIPAVINVTTTNVGTWTAYNTGGPSVQASATATVTVQPAGPPNIDVSPSSLASTQNPNTTTQQALNVGNTGGQDLTWTIFEDASASPELVDWSDNFDSYATGSQLIGQGGWEGWDNNPAAGALTSSAQALSAPNSADILGATDLVHQYSGYTSGQWVYTARQYIPAGFTGRSYFILLNTYAPLGTNNWSTQLCFDATSGLVKDDVPGDCSGTTGLSLVTGQWVEIRVEIDLTADTQAVYYNNQLLFQDTWTGHVSGSGAANIGAVDLYANNASTVYYDDLSLAAPAQPAACDAPADIPWVSVNPTGGTTPAGGSSPVTATFDSTGLAPGVYTGNLCVDSNDPDPGPGNGTSLVIVPVTLTVEQSTAVTLSNLDATQSSAPAPAGLPLAALPAAAGLAMAAVYALRRRR